MWMHSTFVLFFSVPVKQRKKEIKFQLRHTALNIWGASNDHKTKKMVCTLCKVEIKLHCNTSTIRECYSGEINVT